ncbi:hypothetical protein FEM03_00505 [Phragmitibacter flavus]|uniref:Alpha-2-macroglobulin domain-containing protein n=1 Tax=Phragmitibacter flavus TaxID=2576071 RepID=A0A5R8KK24_9BACT|nr:hypothetical protein [Phragmitibacter flavus]TLD72591.1 hypothetical protein FEM03_00505 [Phragmitibacter flavus]
MRRCWLSGIAVVASAWVLSAQVHADDNQAPLLHFPQAREFYAVIAPDVRLTSAKRTAIQAPAKLRGLALGDERSLVWLETSVFNRVQPEKMGYRLVELSFAAGEGNAAGQTRELHGAVDCQIRDADIKQGAGVLAFKLFNTSQSIAVQYSDSDNRFVDVATTPNPWPAEAVVKAAPQANAVLLSSVPPSSGFEYTVQLGFDKDQQTLNLSADFTLAIGPYSSTRKINLPLEKLGNTTDGKPFAPQIQKWLTGQAIAANAPLVINNGNLCALWFKQADRVLALDLQRLQRTLLSRLLADAQQLLTQYDFKSKDFGEANAVLVQLLLAEELTRVLSTELGDAEQSRVLTALSNARSRLEDLVFRLPIRVAGQLWVVFYNIRTKKARLLPDQVRWNPSATPVQFKVPNRDLIFLMSLQATPDFALAADQINPVQKELAEQYQHAALLEANLETGLPDHFTASLALDSDGEKKVPSLTVPLCKRDARNRLLLKLSSKESEAFALRELFLNTDGQGLPLDLSIDSYFVGRTEAKVGATIKGSIKAPDFRIVEARDQKLPITVWVDAPIFTTINADQVTVSLRYPGDTTNYPITVSQSEGSAVLELPLRTLAGITELDVEYQSPVKPGKWINQPGGAEGLILVDE